MASSTPHCSIPAASKPYEAHPFSAQKTTFRQRSQNPAPRPSPRFSVSPSSTTTAAAPKTTNPHSSSQAPSTSKPSTFFSAAKSHHSFSTDFSGKKSTRIVSKLHLNRIRSSTSTKHTSDAEEALHLAIGLPNCNSGLESLLLGFQSKLRGSDDYGYLLRELGNRGEFAKAVQCYEFAVQRERRQIERGKLASSMISIMGRLGKLELAKNVFENAVRQGFGNTVYAYSAMISAYGRCGYSEEAVRLFEMMKISEVKPNLVIYNTVIDACAKGGVDVQVAMDIFNEMLALGVSPDRITFNSLLAVCSRGGLWEMARDFSSEMVSRGIDQDIFTYNTLLDAICKGGQLNLSVAILSEMAMKNVMPNVVTYSTVIDGYAKAGKLDEALKLFDKMKLSGIRLDRVSYNTKLSIYAKLGRFEEALNVCREMENAGIRRDVVTYNALLGGFGKQGKYDEVKRVRDQMKAESVMPNLLTYSTLIDVYSKGGMYQEAMEVFGRFKQAGLKADVVLYSALIDILCKNGLVESAVCWLDEMTREGIKPNVVTYNTIIDALGRSVADEFALEPPKEAGVNGMEMTKGEDIIQNFGQLAVAKSSAVKNPNRIRQEIMCILEIFHEMHKLDIKPNVVTFSAILNACSRCNSFEDASVLLEELRLFDDRVYGVAHGLLTGYRKTVWLQAQSLFDEVKQMDSSTASAFYNALTDVLWHFGQKQGAQLVVLEGKNRNVWENVWSPSCLDLHLMSSGAARAMVHTWLLDIRSNVYNGQKLPDLLSILTGWGKHSKVVGDSTLRKAIEALLSGMGSPFRVAKSNLGRFVSPGTLVAAWLKDSKTLKLLVLEDDRIRSSDQSSQLQPLPT